MTKPVRGLYEVLITRSLEADLRELSNHLEADRRGLRPVEAADRIALHVSRLVQRALETVDDRNRVETGVRLARRIIRHLDKTLTHGALNQDLPTVKGEILQSILARLPDGTPETIDEPLIPLLDTTLLTNAPGDPRVGHQILTEIHSADRIDVVMAFIRRSGIRPLMESMRKHCQAGRSLRVLTTTYTGSTESSALDQLRSIGAEVRVSYDMTTTRLHAKAWLFYRSSNFSTAYIGSSNLTHSAQVTGLEWNVRISGARNADVVDKVAAVFESYWNSPDFVAYDRDDFISRTGDSTRSESQILLSPVELRPEPFQERLLEQIELSRQLGHHRNLLVSATGTGKTVMAAIDYARLKERLQRSRLLFVAHREEILDQSLATFRQGLRDHAFGERWVGGDRPRRFEHVFASIQSMNAAGLADLDPEHFDIVIVDEFHHAAAPSYRALLDHVRPIELLGLTATPERSDGLPLLDWFDGRIAAELRLWDAIDQHRLSPFAYYGIHDGLDLSDVPWRRGRGYDVEGLSNLMTGNDAWARGVIRQVSDHVDNIAAMRALGFCVSVDHARFMARVFREAGIPAEAIWADSPDQERKAALADLAAKRVSVVFSVDLFNEGIDVPVVDTILLLRPTDSPTLFMQQLGRGLRRSPGKTVCTVLDFVGQHRKEFRFDRRLRALFGGSRKDLEHQIEGGFPFLPAGCHMELDPVAAEIVLQSIRQAVPSRWTAKVEELRHLGGSGNVSLEHYIEETSLDLEDIYTGKKSWSDLRADARLPVLAAGPEEETLRRACGRLLHIDDSVRIDGYRRLLEESSAPDPEPLTEHDRRLLKMLVMSVAGQPISKMNLGLTDAARLLWQHPQVRSELRELLGVLRSRIDHVQQPIQFPDVPLRVHARYTRIEILSAILGSRTATVPWREGVYWAKDARADLLAFTLDKTSGRFSPTTRYRDYAISRDLIHWESQSTTRADSSTGLRYQQHRAGGTSIMLFARLRDDDRAFWFLGPADYVSHKSEMPMAVTWRLHHPLPGDLFASFAAAVA